LRILQVQDVLIAAIGGSLVVTHTAMTAFPAASLLLIRLKQAFPAPLRT